MPVIEYKLIKTKEGNEVPAYVKDGGHFRDESNYSMLGWLEPEPRRYYVPDTIIELDRDGVIQRGLKIHHSTPFVRDPVTPEEDAINMDSAEVIELMGTWYDNMVSENS